MIIASAIDIQSHRPGLQPKTFSLVLHPLTFRVRFLLVRVSAGLLVLPWLFRSLIRVSSDLVVCRPGAAKRSTPNSRIFSTTRINMLPNLQHRSSRIIVAHFCALLILFLELSHSVNGLPLQALQARATSKICGASLRPRGLRGLCEEGKSVWHFDRNGDFSKMTLDNQVLRGEVQCGKCSRAPRRLK